MMELWDVYDEGRKKTGKTHVRGIIILFQISGLSMNPEEF